MEDKICILIHITTTVLTTYDFLGTHEYNNYCCFLCRNRVIPEYFVIQGETHILCKFFNYRDTDPEF